MSKKIFSIVVPVFYNELNIPYTVPRLLNLQKDLPDYDIEYIFVDDGSGDESLKLLLEVKKLNTNIKIIKLSKNFGSMVAIQAGIHYAHGNCIGIIAADLQDPPELFADMLSKWEEGYKTVLAVREDRKDPWLQKIISNFYYLILRKTAFPDYPEGGFDFLLFDRQVAEEIRQYSGKHTNILTVIFSLGHKRYYLPYVRVKREIGSSKWTLIKKINLFIDSIISFTYLPLRIMSFIGFIVAIISFFYGLIVIYGYLNGTIQVPGWTALILTLTFFSGLIMIMLGIIGEYLWRILDESRKSPLYLIDEIFE
jgi:polyisoprenyl-phosphate glycosyltransferase